MSHSTDTTATDRHRLRSSIRSEGDDADRRKVLIVIGDGGKVLDTMGPYYRLGEDYQVVLAAPELIPLQVAQSGRGYTPGQITHCKASWWSGSDRWDAPPWPRPLAYGWLVAPGGKAKRAATPS